MTRLALAVVAGALALTALAGCSSADSGTASASPSPSPTPTPTPSEVVWAGEVCMARDNLGAAVSALGRNLSYDISSDRSALEQIDRQLRLQVLSVASAADGLGAALSGVPVDFAAANDLVVDVTKARADTAEAVEQTQASLDAMLAADNILAGVAEAGRALAAGKAAFEAGQVLVGVVTDAVSSANDELRAAFDAAPECT